MISSKSLTGSISETENLNGSLSSSYSLEGSVSSSGTLIQAYTLPIASAKTLGGIKVGANLTIEKDGTLNATASGSGEGTTDYTALSNKPKINNVELTGNKTLDQLGIQAKGDYAKTNDIPTKVSQLTNDSKFASESYVSNAIANAQLGGGEVDIDLSGYATKDDLNNKADKNSIPTKVSQLTNDSGYITSIPSEYITETELNAKGYLTSIPSTYKTKTENDALYQAKGNYLTSIPDEYVTETELNNALANVGGGSDASSRKNNLYGKIINCLGDSITEGYLANKNYSDYIRENNQATVNNYGISGSTISGGDKGYHSLCERYIEMTDNADYVFVMGGTNDFIHSIKIGENDSKDTSTFKGSLNVLIEGLINKYPHSKIAFSTPIPFKFDDEYLESNLNKYVSAVLEICQKWSIPCLNLYACSRINPNNATMLNNYFSRDLESGVHPDENGQKIMSEIIESFLNDLYVTGGATIINNIAGEGTTTPTTDNLLELTSANASNTDYLTFSNNTLILDNSDGFWGYGLEIAQPNLTLKAGETYIFSCDNIKENTWININGKDSFMISSSKTSAEYTPSEDIVSPTINFWIDSGVVYDNVKLNLILKDANSINTDNENNVLSDIIKKIMVVDELPTEEVEGVLYLVKEIEVDDEEPTNEYVTSPTMEMGSISRDGTLSDSTTSCRTSDYVYVYGKSKITITNGLGSSTRILCYDENKNFMTNWFVDGSTTYSYRQVADSDNMTIPNGCHYIKAKVDSEIIITLTIGYTD